VGGCPEPIYRPPVVIRLLLSSSAKARALQK